MPTNRPPTRVRADDRGSKSRAAAPDTPSGRTEATHSERPVTMRILVHDFAGHAFPMDLSRGLAARGHDVLHVYCRDVPAGQGDLTSTGGVRVHAVPVRGGFSRYSLTRRPAQEVAYGRDVATVLDRARPDVVVSGNAPLMAQRRIQRAAHRRGAAFVYWLQDVLGVGTTAALSRRLGAAGRAAGAALLSLESRMLRDSDAVVPITPDFCGLVVGRGVRPDVVEVIENWAPLGDLPTRPRRNAWSRAQGLDDTFVFLYTGTLGYKHDPSLLLELAKSCESTPDACVVVVSEGLGAEYLKAQRDVRGLTRLRVLPYQPYCALPDVLAAGDVLTALLTEDAGVFSVPSKVLSYLCASRPLLAALPERNQAAHLLREAGCALIVRPGDAEAFTAAAGRLRADTALRARLGAAGRRHAITRFDSQITAARFEAVAERAYERRAARAAPAPPYRRSPGAHLRVRRCVGAASGPEGPTPTGGPSR